MADAPPDEGYPGMPRWVKITILAGASVLLLALLLAHLLGGGGPASHLGP